MQTTTTISTQPVGVTTVSFGTILLVLGLIVVLAGMWQKFRK